ncbi:hypothetical protein YASMINEVIRUS_1518 [Yasminevirus sp. GU-2018]|uniref:Uncharacterized protein n=1 Tax=Yasminevirus sp. GU-2018 TaxID=2420051 RepID=A0A5K0UC92_9VIRU|nr:hypothetical protein YASMINEVIRUS_1518 [Yasminevirus sp. GU-2018]
MSRTNQKSKSKATTKSQHNDDLCIMIDPDIVYFTHSRFRKQFTGCNKTIDQTLNEIRSGQITVNDIPKITVYTDDNHYYSQNNRRLYLFKTCKKEGLLHGDVVSVFVKRIPVKKSYSAETCSLTGKPCLP